MNLWQQLFDAVKTRMQLIRVVNGFETEVGACAFTWRDLSRSPWREAEMEVSLGAFNLRDASRLTHNGSDSYGNVINCHVHEVEFEVNGACLAGKISPPENHARRMICDIDRAIGIDTKWTIDGVKLAVDTQAGSDQIEVAHSGDRIIQIRKTFKIFYRTGRFSPASAS